MKHTATVLVSAIALLLCQNASAENIQRGIKPLDRGPAKVNGKRPVCLTFDDGPSGRTTPMVLEVLRQHRIPGCFFVIGNKAEGAQAQALLRRMVAEGHTVGNHTLTHPAENRGRNCATLSPAQFEHEVRTAGGIIMRATDLQPKFFRFPGGFAKQETVQHLKRLGYTKAGWHTDPWDWWGYWSRSLESRQAHKPSWMPADKIGNFVDYAVWAAQVNKGGLFLLHDIKEMTANKLDALVTKLKANNFVFVPITDRQTFPVMNSWLDQQN